MTTDDGFVLIIRYTGAFVLKHEDIFNDVDQVH